MSRIKERTVTGADGVKDLLSGFMNSAPISTDQQPCPVCAFHTCARALWHCGPKASDKTSALVQHGYNAHTARDPGRHQGRDQETGVYLAPAPALL